MRTVLVTGGAGFIGSYVVEQLLDEGHQVFVADNLSAGAQGNLPSNAELCVVDIRGPEFAALVGRVRPDTIVHLAAQVSVKASVEDPVSDADVNVSGTLKVLEAAREHKVQNFVFSSSAAVYGVPGALPIREDAPLVPMSPYGIAKAAAEAYTRAYCQIHGLRAVVMRYSNVFGPRQRADGDGGVVAKFVEALVRGDSPIFYGDGSQTRDFIYVKDVAAATVRAVEYLTGAVASQCLVANISSCRQTSLKELYDLLRRVLKRTPEPTFAPPREGDIWHSCLDNTTALEYLGWVPSHSLEQGILETVSAVQCNLLKASS